MATSISASTTLSLAAGTNPASLAGAKDAFLNSVFQAHPNARIMAQTDTFLSVVTPNPQNPSSPTLATAILVTVVFDPNPAPTAVVFDPSPAPITVAFNPSPAPMSVTLEGPLSFTTTSSTSKITGNPGTSVNTTDANGNPITVTTAPDTTSTGTITLP